MQYQRLLESKNELDDYENSIIERFQFMVKGVYTPHACALVRQLCALGCSIKNAGQALNFIYQQLCRPLLPPPKQIEDTLDKRTARRFIEEIAVADELKTNRSY